MSHDTFELTHLAIWVADVKASIKFYETYAGMSILKERIEPSGTRVAWMTDDHKRLILGLLCPRRMPLAKRLGIALARLLGPPFHIGVECSSREVIERRCETARAARILRKAPRERGGNTGYVGIIADPDGNDLELSFGQNNRDHLKPAT